MRFAISAVYYDDRKADLIRDCLLPEAGRLAKLDGVGNVYVQRHWKHGPHVRLCVRADDAWDASPAQAARGRIESYMEANPSRTAIEPVQYRMLSESLGRRELVPPPYEPLWPNNTVMVGEYDPRQAVLGSETAVRFKEEMLARSRGPLARTLAAIGLNPASRLACVLRLLTMAACTYPDGGLIRGQLSYRSHVEDYLFDHDRDGRIRRAFEGKSVAVAREVDRVVAEIVGDTTDAGYAGPDPILRAWWKVVDHGWKVGVPLTEDGLITDSPDNLAGVAAQFDEWTREKWDPPADRQYSYFHRKLRRLRRTTVPRSVGNRSFAAYRWLVNLMYTCFPLLDVSPMERYCVSFIIAEAAERHFGVTWETILDDVYEGRVPDVIQEIRSRA